VLGKFRCWRCLGVAPIPGFKYSHLNIWRSLRCRELVSWGLLFELVSSRKKIDYQILLEHIFKKSALLKSLCRPSVRPWAISQPLWHLESWNLVHKSVGLTRSMVRSGILESKIWFCGPGVRESGHDLDPFQEKYAFLSITSEHQFLLTKLDMWELVGKVSAP
jgi:hypothetical protein